MANVELVRHPELSIVLFQGKLGRWPITNAGRSTC